MNLDQLLDSLRQDRRIAANLTHWERLPPAAARHAPPPAALDSRLSAVLAQKGIAELYSHQAEAVGHTLAGENVVVVTPTASGKTLCYNLPVLHAILQNPAARAIYLFPTKALAQDQLVELTDWSDRLDAGIKTYTYDGDTPVAARRSVRQAGHIVVTNPDMLHTGILPHHTKWVRLFENLQYVVIDELHQYRGVFGSHLAGVLRRLDRICRFYGARPRYICSSATIANPQELAERLIGAPVRLVDQSGAPRGEKHLLLYNPPVINRELGIRRGVIREAAHLAARLIKNGVQTIVFARTRAAVELLTTYIKEEVGAALAGRVRGYRGGYLPGVRRQIEHGLRAGQVLGVVSTNALELGIDIGRLQACIMAGYPGSVASAWQQAGRAGRRQETSLAILIASSSPLDQYIVEHPDYLLGRSPEHGLVNPDNLHVLVAHLKCAAFELPFSETERFGVETTQEMLAYLAEERVLRRTGGKWHWMTDHFPADDISLRSAAAANVVIIDTTVAGRPRVIGEIDPLGAMTMVHTDAVYIHEAEQYHVDRLEWAELKAYVHRVDVDYYTDANLAVTIKVLDTFKTASVPGATRHFGEVMTTAKATIFKKIKLHTHENLGWGKIHLPEYDMHTTAYWLSLDPAAVAGFAPDALQSALIGLSHALGGIAPLYLMCDPRDIRTVVQVRSPFTDQPTLYLYDTYPGGVGLAEKCYDLHTTLLQSALAHVQGCACAAGCPACIGPALEAGDGARRGTILLLQRLLDPRTAAPVPPGEGGGGDRSA